MPTSAAALFIPCPTAWRDRSTSGRLRALVSPEARSLQDLHQVVGDRNLPGRLGLVPDNVRRQADDRRRPVEAQLRRPHLQGLGDAKATPEHQAHRQAGVSGFGRLDQFGSLLHREVVGEFPGLPFLGIPYLQKRGFWKEGTPAAGRIATRNCQRQSWAAPAACANWVFRKAKLLREFPANVVNSSIFKCQTYSCTLHKIEVSTCWFLD